MLAFVDESGDSGRKIINGSSQLFVVAMVTFEDNEEALECDTRISLLKSELGLPDRYEFHYAHNSRKVKEAFLNAIAPYPFFYHVFALNKDPEKLTGPGFQFRESLYKYATRITFENAKPYLVNATVVIDRSGDRKFRDELAAYLRRRVRDENNRRIIKKVKIQRSDGNNLLQLADYVAGIANREMRGRSQEVIFRRQYLSAHEISRQIWPK